MPKRAGVKLCEFFPQLAVNIFPPSVFSLTTSRSLTLLWALSTSKDFTNLTIVSQEEGNQNTKLTANSKGADAGFTP